MGKGVARGLRRVGLALASAASFAAACSTGPDTISVGGFTIDPSPSASFLTLSIRGGMTNERWSYSFFGDGKVQFDRLDRQDPPKALESWTTQLSDAEMRGLLSDLGGSGLLELDPQAVIRRERSEGKYRVSPTDQGSIQVDIALRRRRWGGLLGREKVKNRFSLGGQGVPSQAPDIPVFEAYRRVMTLSGELRHRATPVLAPPPIFMYSYPQDDRPAVVLTSLGTHPPYVVSLSLYASGRAVIGSSLAAQYHEVVLGEEDRDRVLRDIEEGGLALYDEKAVALEQERLAGGRVVGYPAEPNLPAFTVQLRVREDSGAGAEPRELSQTMTIFGPGALAERFPSIPAVKALADLEQLLWEMESFAKDRR